jgi:hypothetical protein
MPILLIVSLVALLAQAPPTPAALVDRYIKAAGGEAALRAVNSRTTEGEFDNGRGLRTRFRIIEAAPNMRVTLIGPDPIDSPTGSGRGYDGAMAWDKSFIGTGLRVLEGRELADAARDADLFRPLHLLDDCQKSTIEATGRADVVLCLGASGSVVKHAFDRRTGLLAAQDISGGPRTVHITYEDYRAVGALRLPFKTHIDVAGAVIKYDAATIRLDEPVDRAIFQQPRQ